jgi:hypothetical protein
MKPKPYTVHIVIAPNYGKRLRDLPKGEPAWILDTPINRQACQGNSSEDTPNSHLVGYTLFKYSTEDSPEEMLLSLLENIELHHGELSHAPPYSILNVIGVKWSGNIATRLAEFGFTTHKETAEGFIIKRAIGQDTS